MDHNTTTTRDHPQTPCRPVFSVMLMCCLSVCCLSVCQLFGWIGEKFKLHVMVFGILSIMAMQGAANLQAQWGIMGEFSNLPQEQLLDWIRDNTRPRE